MTDRDALHREVEERMEAAASWLLLRQHFNAAVSVAVAMIEEHIKAAITTGDAMCELVRAGVTRVMQEKVEAERKRAEAAENENRALEHILDVKDSHIEIIEKALAERGHVAGCFCNPDWIEIISGVTHKGRVDTRCAPVKR